MNRRYTRYCLLVLLAAYASIVRAQQQPILTCEDITSPTLSCSSALIDFLLANRNKGTITGVVAGDGLQGGGTSGSVRLDTDSTVARTNRSNSFAGNQDVTGNFSVTGSVS